MAANIEGRTLGDFVVGPKIGEGGFGAVYRAQQVTLDRAAVIKVLHHHLLGGGTTTDRFLREARLASRLDHPYAAHIYSFGADRDGTLWIAMELVRGTPLSDYLRAHGPTPLERLVPLLERICEVVHTAHEQGIVHRDIKPSNVMVLSRAGRLLPKLLDFGIAKGIGAGETESLGATFEAPAATLPEPLEAAPGLGATMDASGEGDAPDADATAVLSRPSFHDQATITPSSGPAESHRALALDAALTQQGAVMGSPHYMAPEQWNDASSASSRSDLYALGVLAYEAMTGKPPFVGSFAELAAAHLRESPPPLPEKLPSRLNEVIARALAKRPDDRYATALELADAFRKAAGLRAEAPPLPRLDEAVRERYVAFAPRPLAEAVAALDAATDLRQARDALWIVTSVLARWLGALALSARSRVGPRYDDHASRAAVREAGTTLPSDEGWFGIAQALTRAHAAAPDLHPLPELVLLLCEPTGDDGAGPRLLAELAAMRAGLIAIATTDETLRDALKAALDTLARLLDEASFVCDYEPVHLAGDGSVQSWSGLRGQRRDGGDALTGAGSGVLLVDRARLPVLALDPLFRVAPPTSSDPPALFVFAGRDDHGALMSAAPLGFELHDHEVLDWLRGQMDISGDDDAELVAGEGPPYLGLSAFTAEDSERFLGRERQVDAGVNRLQVEAFLAVVGPSGVGKSSYVQAGLLPALASWRAVIVRPGAEPTAALLAALTGAGASGLSADPDQLGAQLRDHARDRGPLIVVIDQLEEMFTLCHDDSERAAFAAAIAGIARTAADPTRVVVTLRDDFLVTAGSVAALRDRIPRGMQLLTIPDRDDLIRIVEEPARRAGYTFEDPALPERMVDEVAGQPSALALLSFTAAELWERRDRHFRRLPTRAYTSLGGVGGALAGHAEHLLQELTAAERRLVREAFRRLVTADGTRAILTRAELSAAMDGGAAAAAVIERLVASRLLVAREGDSTDDDEIEVTHEALISAWPRLVEWRREDAEGARLRDQLRAAALQWEQRGRASGLLWRGDALAEYRLWRARYPGALTPIENAFATASQREASRSVRRRRAGLGVAFAMLLAGSVALLLLNTRAARQRARAEASEAAANASAAELEVNLRAQYEDRGRRQVLDGDPHQGLTYLHEASKLGAAGPAHDLAVAQAVRAISSEVLRVNHGSMVYTLGLSPDGAVMVSCGVDERTRVWDARSGAVIIELAHHGEVTRCEFSADGSKLITASGDGLVSLWDAGTWQRQRTFPGHVAPLRCAEMTADGRHVATMDRLDRVRLWDATSGALEHTLAQGRSDDDYHYTRTPCALRRDGARLAAGDSRGVLRVWDVASGELVAERAGHREKIMSVRFAPGGELAATASLDGTAVVWDTRDWQPRRSFLHQNVVTEAILDRGASRLFTTSVAGTGMVWDVRTGVRRATIGTHTGPDDVATFRADGMQIAVGSGDGTVQLWDPDTGRLEARLLAGGPASALQYGPSGARLFVASWDGTVSVHETDAHLAALVLRDALPSTAAAFSPDSTQVVTGGLDGRVRIWALTGAPIRELEGDDQPGRIWRVLYSPDGTRIAAAANDGVLRVWDAASGRLRWRLAEHTAPILDLAWLTGGDVVATASEDGTARLWALAQGTSKVYTPHGGKGIHSIDVNAHGEILTTGADSAVVRSNAETGEVLERSSGLVAPYLARFAPDGSRFATVTTAEVSVQGPGRKAVSLQRPDGMIVDVGWSPDGALIITAGRGGTAELWDAQTGSAIARLGPAEAYVAASFSPDGRRAVTVDTHRVATLWSLPEPVHNLDDIMECRGPYRRLCMSQGDAHEVQSDLR